MWALNAMTWLLTNMRQRECWDWRGRGNVTTETKAISRGTPGASRQWKRQGADSCLKNWTERGSAATLIADFWTPEFWENKFLFFFFLCHSVCGNLLQQPQRTNTKHLIQFVNVGIPFRSWRNLKRGKEDLS